MGYHLLASQLNEVDLDFGIHAHGWGIAGFASVAIVALIMFVLTFIW